MKYAPKNENCTSIALKCERSNTPFKYGIKISFIHVINPHMKNSEVMTIRGIL